MAWTIELSARAKKELANISHDQQDLIEGAFERMKENPFFGKVTPLKGKEWKGVYRRTVGRWRLFILPRYSERVAHIVTIRLRNEKTYR